MKKYTQYLEVLGFILIFIFIDYGARLLSKNQTNQLESIISTSFKEFKNIQCSYILNLCYIEYLSNETINAKDITIENINEFNNIDINEFKNIKLNMKFKSIQFKYNKFDYLFQNLNLNLNVSLDGNKKLLIHNNVKFKKENYNITTYFNTYINEFNVNKLDGKDLILINNFKFEILKFNNNNLSDLSKIFNFDNNNEIYQKFLKDTHTNLKFNAELNILNFKNIKDIH